MKSNQPTASWIPLLFPAAKEVIRSNEPKSKRSTLILDGCTANGGVFFRNLVGFEKPIWYGKHSGRFLRILKFKLKVSWFNNNG